MALEDGRLTQLSLAAILGLPSSAAINEEESALLTVLQEQTAALRELGIVDIPYDYAEDVSPDLLALYPDDNLDTSTALAHIEKSSAQFGGTGSGRYPKGSGKDPKGGSSPSADSGVSGGDGGGSAGIDSGRKSSHLSKFNADKLQAQALDGGFTYSVVDKTSPETGFSVSPYGERTRAISVNVTTPSERMGEFMRFAEDNKDLLAKPGHYMGSWRDTSEGKDRIVLDVVILGTTQVEGEAIAIKHDEKAIYDLGSGTVIFVGGKGHYSHGTVEEVGSQIWERSEPFYRNRE